MYLYVQFPILCRDNVVLIVLLGLGFFFFTNMAGKRIKNIQWFHSYKCWNTVLYSDLRLPHFPTWQLIYV